jgi:hypothetical protein
MSEDRTALLCPGREVRERGVIIRRIFEYVIEQDASEQLDRLFDESAQAASLRAAQGIGLNETIDEMPTRLPTN